MWLPPYRPGRSLISTSGSYLRKSSVGRLKHDSSLADFESRVFQPPRLFSSVVASPTFSASARQTRRCSTEPNRNGKLEEILAQDLQSYLRDCGSVDEADQQQLRAVCSTLARILGQLLQGNEKWSVYYWVDAILPISTTADSGELKIYGLMIWGQSKQTQQWVEPFLGSVRLSETGNRVICRLMCGDAARGLGRLPYGKSNTRAGLRLPEEWLFSFLEQ